MKHYVLRKSEYKLYRTKYSVPPDPFNNTEKFKKSVLKIKRLIHRMQFSISYKYHEQIIQSFKEHFEYKGVRKTKRRTIHRYKLDNSLIRITLYDDKESCWWFSININNVNGEVFRKILSLLYLSVPFIDRKSISLSQCEITYDFYPREGVNMYMFGIELTKGLVRRYSKIGVFNSNDWTQYYGNKGDVRKGSHGIRCYPRNKKSVKGIPEFIRYEFQANRGVLKKYALSKTFSPFDIDLREYIEFRQSLDEGMKLKLTNAICKKKNIDLTDKSSMKSRIQLSCIMREFSCHACKKYDWCYYSENDFLLAPVTCQINAFKIVKKKVGITHQVDCFFLKIAA